MRGGRPIKRRNRAPARAICILSFLFHFRQKAYRVLTVGYVDDRINGCASIRPSGTSKASMGYTRRARVFRSRVIPWKSVFPLCLSPATGFRIFGDGLRAAISGRSREIASVRVRVSDVTAWCFTRQSCQVTCTHEKLRLLTQRSDIGSTSSRWDAPGNCKLDPGR